MGLHGVCRFNGRILLANLLQSSRSTFSWGSFPSFFAFKEGMLGTQISALGGWPTVSGRYPCTWKGDRWLQCVLQSATLDEIRISHINKMVDVLKPVQQRPKVYAYFFTNLYAKMRIPPSKISRSDPCSMNDKVPNTPKCFHFLCRFWTIGTRTHLR